MKKSLVPIIIFSVFLIAGLPHLIPGIILMVLNINDLDSAGMFVGLILTIIGFVFSATGGIGLYVIFSKRKTNAQLKANGTRISADYVETIVNESVHVQYRHPYNIICEWNNPADGKKYIFRSGNIWFNPENMIKENCLNKFDVYYDEKNIKKYVVDIDCLNNNVVDLS